MSRQLITPGSAPIVWSTVEEAFTKINANFQELYASIGDVGSVGFDALETDLVPADNGTYDLGTPQKRWDNLYLGNTLMIGGAAITNEGLTIDLPSGTTVGGSLIIDFDKAFFKEFSVNGETSIIAAQFNDVLDFQENTGIGITTNSSANAIIIENTGVTSILAGTAMSVSGATGSVTVNNAGVTSAIAGLGMSVSSATGAVTIANGGIIDIDAGLGISVGARDPLTGKVIITNTQPSGNSYRSIAVAGQPTLTARSAGDTLTFIEGAGVQFVNTLAGGAFTNRVTVTNTGVTSLSVSGQGLTVDAATGNINLAFDNRVDIIGSVFADDSTMLVDGTNGRIVGPVFANVTGNLTGVVTGSLVGSVSGNVTGDVQGNVTGSLTGNVRGDLIGSVFADDSTVLIDGTGGKIVGPVETSYVQVTGHIQTGVYADLTAIATAYPVPNKGMIVFDDDTNQFRGYDGSSWVALN